MKDPIADHTRSRIRDRGTKKTPSGDDFSTRGLPTYEQRLARDPRWALSEGSRHFEEKSAVFDALRKIASRLDEIGVQYAIVDGMALFHHGVRRFTEDVDILVTKADLKRIHERLNGLGYLPPYSNSKHLRDTEHGVKIEFLTTGEYPGDGKAKPVAFPDPSLVSFKSEGISYLELPTLIELKLASGMTNAGRLKDLSDVLELIKTLGLPASFADRLNPFVKQRFLELWNEGRKQYEMLWRNKWLTSEAKTLEDMVAMLRHAADQLEEMAKAGVVLKDDGGVSEDYATLSTTDPDVAKRFGMDEEREYLEEED